MAANTANPAMRALLLIATPKLTGKAEELLQQLHIPVQYHLHADGTAPSEMLDMLGLGNVDKSALLCFLPKSIATATLKKLNKALRLEAAGSGIAVTLPLTGMNNLLLQMLTPLATISTEDRKDEKSMTESTFVLIAAAVNQGYSDDVMSAAKTAGAGGGTILHSRHNGDENAMSHWGLNLQEEKEIVLIVAPVTAKLAIMRAISEKCGVHSEAKGIVVSLPLDSVVGISEDE